MSKEIKKFECLEDRMLVREIKNTEPEKTEAGIITDTIKKPTKTGIVVNAGQGRYAIESGTFMPCVLKTGDTVLYPANGGLEIDIPTEDGSKETCTLWRESDILMLISKKSSE